MFAAIVTTTGQAKIADALANGTPLDLTEFAVGDGDDGAGNIIVPQASWTQLQNEQYRASILSVAPDGASPNIIRIEGQIPGNIGGWYIREVGIFDSAGDLIFVLEYPETLKPVLASGATVETLIQVAAVISDIAAINLVIDPNQTLATVQQVNDLQAQIDTLNTDVATQALVKHVPVGTILKISAATAPDTTVKTDGAAYLEATYPELFAVIGFDYTEPALQGTGQFRIPDTRGLFDRYWDDGAGVDPDAATRTARADGNGGDLPGTTQDDEFKSHTHDYVNGVINNISGTHPRVGYVISNAPESVSLPTGGSETRSKNIAFMGVIKYM